MISQTLVKRYTQGLAGALMNEAEYQAVSLELSDFLSLLSSHKQLRDVLSRPFLTTNRKIQIIKEIVSQKSYQEKTARFLLLLLEHKRLDFLSEILKHLPILWKEKKGVMTFEVRSVVPLQDGQKKRLQAELEQIEKSPVHLEYIIDPGLLGGLYIQKGNMVYDVSLKGHLLKLREKMCER